MAQHQRYRFEQPPKGIETTRNARRGKPFEVGTSGFEYTGSGKAAIRLVLDYLARKGVLTNKMSPIHVPSWIGAAVYQTIIESGFPVTSSEHKPKVVIAYHQYGFPQDMDRVRDYAASLSAVLIEDCAHAPYSFRHDSRAGAMSDFGIFSFSKFSFCRTLGGVSFTDSGFSAYYKEALSKSSNTFSKLVTLFKTADEWHLSRDRQHFDKAWTLLRKMTYAIYGDLPAPNRRSVSLWSQKWEEEITCRRDIYKLYRDRFDKYGLCDHLEASDVTPYVVPIRVKSDNAQTIVDTLQQHNIECGIRQFDMKRFFVEPDFQPCVILPINSTLGLQGAEQIADIIDAIICKKHTVVYSGKNA